MKIQKEQKENARIALMCEVGRMTHLVEDVKYLGRDVLGMEALSVLKI